MKWAEIYMLIVLAKIGKSSSPCSIVNDCLLWQIAHMYVCMYVCLSVCMYVYIYICWCSNWTWWFSIALLNYWRVKLNFPCSNGSFFPSWVLLIWNARIIQWFQNEHNIVSQCSPYIYIPFVHVSLSVQLGCKCLNHPPKIKESKKQHPGKLMSFSYHKPWQLGAVSSTSLMEGKLWSQTRNVGPQA